MLQNTNQNSQALICNHNNLHDQNYNYVCVQPLCNVNQHQFCFQCMLDNHNDHIYNCINLQSANYILQIAIYLLSDILYIDLKYTNLKAFKLFCLKKLRVLKKTLKNIQNISKHLEQLEFAFNIKHLFRQFMMGFNNLTEEIISKVEEVLLEYQQIFNQIGQIQVLKLISQYLYKEAITYCQWSLQSSNDIEILILKGHCLHMLNHLEEAEQVYKEALNLQPNDSKLISFVVQLIESSQSKILQNVTVNFSCTPKNVIDILVGKKMLIQGKYKQAIRILENCVQEDQNNFVAITFQGLCLFKIKMIKEAKENCERALKIYPRYYAAIYLKYLILLSEKQEKEAKQLVQQNLNPLTRNAILSNQFLCYLNEINYSELENMINQRKMNLEGSLVKKSQDIQMINLLPQGLQLLSKQKYNDAIKTFEEGIKINNNNEQFWKYKMITLFLQNRFLEVKSSCQTYLTINPKSREILNIKSKQFYQSIQDLVKFISFQNLTLEPQLKLSQIIKQTEDIQQLYEQGFLCVQGKFYSKASEIYTQIIELDPIFDEAKFKKIYCLICLKDFTKVYQMLEYYYETGTYSMLALQMKGIALYEQNNYDEALKIFQLIEEVDPNVVFVRFYQAHCYYKLKQFYQAKDIYFELLNKAQSSLQKQSYAIRYFKTIYALKYIDDFYLRYLPKELEISIISEPNSKQDMELFLLWLFIIRFDRDFPDNSLFAFGQRLDQALQNCSIFLVKAGISNFNEAELFVEIQYYSRAVTFYTRALEADPTYEPALVGICKISNQIEQIIQKFPNYFIEIKQSFNIKQSKYQYEEQYLHEIFLNKIEEYEGKMFIPESYSIPEDIFHQFNYLF